MITQAKALLCKGSLATHGINVKLDLIGEIRQKGTFKNLLFSFHNPQREEPSLYIPEHIIKGAKSSRLKIVLLYMFKGDFKMS